jgi:hypothetical protein
MYSRVAGEDGVLVGVEGALLVNHRLAIGGAGYIWTGGDNRSVEVDGTLLQRDVAYGGLILRYSILTGSPLYASVGGLVGGGAVVLGGHDRYDDDFDGNDLPHATDGFFVFEPQVSVHVNLVRWMRVGLQGGYRITSGLGEWGYTEADLNGPTIGGTVQFGFL